MGNPKYPGPGTSADQRVAFDEFLSKYSPGKTAIISNLGVRKSLSTWPLLIKPRLKLFCEGPFCKGTRYFDTNETQSIMLTEKWSRVFLLYVCSNCRARSKIFALMVRWNVTVDNGEGVKVGEWPPFGPSVTPRVLSFVGRDRELFLMGRRAEVQGLGIGSFAYYRRVIISQKDHLIDEIIKVMRRHQAYESDIEKLMLAKSESQFEKIADLSIETLPPVLNISGENPLILLDRALSKGTYVQTDQEYLKLAGVIRLVLTELAERISAALADKSEISSAVRYLMDT